MPEPIPTILDQNGNPIGQENDAQLLDKSGEILDLAEREKNDGKEAGEEVILPSGPAKDYEKDRKQNREKQIDDDIVIGYMMRVGLDEENKEFFDLFKNILSERYKDRENKEQEWKEVAELIKGLPEKMARFDSEIAQLSKEPGFEQIKDKRNEITKALCESVLNGHLTAKDVLACIGNIKIIPNEKAKAQGGVCFYHHESQTLLFSPEFLKDRPTNASLNIKHLVSHELSHAVTRFGGIIGEAELAQMKAYQEKGEAIISESLKPAMEIIQQAEETKDFQPQHIRNILNDLKNIENDFNALPDKNKQAYGGLEGYRRYREVMGAEEIVTDYTAYFMESNGTLENFYMKILNGLNMEAVGNYLGQGKTKTEAQRWITELNNRVAKGENIIEIAGKEPKLRKMIETYSTFYKLASSHKDKFKGKIADNVPKTEGDDEAGLGDYCADSAQSFGGDQGSGAKQEPGMISELGALFKAFAQAVDVASVTGGSSSPI